MFCYFSGLKPRKFNVIHNPSSSQHYDRPTIVWPIIDVSSACLFHIFLLVDTTVLVLIFTLISIDCITLCIAYHHAYTVNFIDT